ncbi:hypothetical protein IJ114_03135 [Candidatus Saccharibacteria bacterium]|nr:hypothetical protein [Candidatus Saccharibacteria bacterium]
MTLTLRKLLSGVFGVLGIISLFLPWYRVTFFGNSLSANAFGGDYTWIAIINLIAAALMILLVALPEKMLKSFNKMIVEKDKLISVILGAIIAFLTLLAMIMYTSSSYGMGFVGFGWYFTMIAGIGAVVVNILKTKELENVVVKDNKVVSKSVAKKDETTKADAKKTDTSKAEPKKTDTKKSEKK